PAGGPHPMVADSQDARLLLSCCSFAPAFAGGICVGSGDINDDGRPDVIVGAGPGGGPHVKVIDGTKLGQVQADGQIADGALLASFYASAPGFTGGVSVASDDVHRDGRTVLALGAGPAGRPHVTATAGTKLNQAKPN